MALEEKFLDSMSFRWGPEERDAAKRIKQYSGVESLGAAIRLSLRTMDLSIAELNKCKRRPGRPPSRM